jgi:uncharacterized protein (TIGR02646 family)
MAANIMVRSKLPARRKVDPQDSYKKYRKELREDFNNSCGYCGDSDERCDKSIFHIDHFAPQSLFPELALDYANLVYSCRYCNVSKSNHWLGTDSSVANDGISGFVDPCDQNYDVHLGRSSSGRICANTKVGAYIVKRLKLHLLRHELLWKSRRMRELRVHLDDLIEEIKLRKEPNRDQLLALLEKHRDLTRKIDEYERGAYA